MPISLPEFCVVTVIMMFGTLVQASVGFGLAVLSAPLLLLFDPDYIPGPIIVPILLLTTLMAHRDRHAIQRDVLALATAGRILGTIPAAYAVGVMSQTAFDTVFGLMVFGAVVLSIAHWHISATDRNVFIASAISGFTGTISSIGGPPLALVFQREAGKAIRGTLASIFLIGAVVSLFSLWCVGRFDRHHAALAAMLTPGMLVGFAASRWTVEILDGGHTRLAVLVLSATAGAIVLYRAIL